MHQMCQVVNVSIKQKQKKLCQLITAKKIAKMNQNSFISLNYANKASFLFKLIMQQQCSKAVIKLKS